MKTVWCIPEVGAHVVRADGARPGVLQHDILGGEPVCLHLCLVSLSV